MAPSFNIRVNEDATFLYKGTLKNENGVVMGPTDLITLVLTLKDADTGTIINSRDHQNILNANGVTVTTVATDNLQWTATGDDNPIISTDVTLESELHIALFEWTYGVGLEGNKEIAIRVVQISGVQ